MDAGPVEPDAGTPDAGTSDAGHDGGLDGGEPDAGPVTCASPWQGDRQEGTAAADETLSVWVSEAGDLYTTGYWDGRLGESNIEPSGDSRAVITRHAADGRLLWRRSLDTAGTDTAEHVVGGRERGTVQVVGRTTGALEGHANGGQFDVFLLQLDGDGNTLRTVQQGDERPQHPAKVAVDSAGQVVVAGYDDLFVQNKVSLDAENGFVARFPAPAQGPLGPSWRVRSQVVDNPDRLTGLALTPDGDALFTSGFRFFADEDGPGGAFVQRRDPADGHVVWTSVIAPTGTEADELLLTPDHQLLLAGSSLLALEPGVPIVGEADVFLALLEPDSGQVQWVRQVGTRGSDQATALARAPHGDIYVAGDTLGSFPGFTNQGGRDLFVLRFSADGRLLGLWQQGTPQDDHVTGLAVDACGNAVVVGSTEGGLVPGSPPLGSRDAFLLRLSPPTLPLGR
ncbi:SBBP repeat-containing protein [Corallococcus sp. bb12-1]|uniref:SBBP repeat-containing protein n=1 Tax=Corallococcus sp. bb12-1 TaxID=2996784 RepID=UPI00226EA9DF|nr:SBBP repeat-containing protein [Corallococcus sp. bb12-1]MCY1043794.1 SBBP repeat-containing protein [Corallococcus sp. bb12-1]